MRKKRVNIHTMCLKKQPAIALFLSTTAIIGQLPKSQSSFGSDRGPKSTSIVAPADGNDRIIRGKSNKPYKACPPPFDPNSCIEEKTGKVRLHPRPF